ncbi:hypothetical protein [Streptomyces rugosispiralis]|uniref:Uncharacterized protein n=1 Tax=Streptomyces rugosispiralis TaxID=2967341 RepID=A0ABT1V0R9_9ACTN|nr:hypothetical protein [Streptomyces rugosispiralis]MCQ8190618.1 hypothetical protein [Streptomyces rugosispiralis]
MSEEDLRRRGLPASALKERVSYMTLGLLAAGAGCFLSDPQLDYDCLDVTVIGSGPHQRRRPRFDVQIKASSVGGAARARAGGDFSISLPRDQYENLRAPAFLPIKFVAHIFPRGTEIPRVVTQGDRMMLDGIMLRSDPREWRPLPSGQESGAVHLRREDVFDIEYIKSEIKILGDGGGW